MPRRILTTLATSIAATAVCTLGPIEAAGDVQFLHALDNKPLALDLRPDQTLTPAVKAFHQKAENPYRGNAEAIADGEKLYQKLCQACHLKDGTGRIGPNIVDDDWKYPRTATDQGKFEILYAGGAGAMQAFGLRIDQDEILRLMAYLDVLRERKK